MKKRIYGFITMVLSLSIIMNIANCFNTSSLERKASIEKKFFNSNEISSISDTKKAIQEIADSYYRRGKNIQYNSSKGNVGGFFSPEEATEQDMHYMVCSSFVKNVYYELCGIKTPLFTYNYLSGSGERKGLCSVITGENNLECSPNLNNKQLIGQGYGLVIYGHRGNNNNLMMEIYGSKSGNYISTVNNPTLQNIIPRLKIRRYYYSFRAFNVSI